MSSPIRASSGTLDLQLPRGTSKAVPWLVDAPGEGNGSGNGTALLLLHGAGGDAASGSLPVLAAAAAATGSPCLRITARSSSLDHRVAVTKAALAQAHTLPGLAGVERWVVAGHSMGARVAAALAGDPECRQQYRIGGTALLSYPMHPPGKPDEAAGPQRVGLLRALRTPVLLVGGDRDPFCAGHWQTAVAALASGCPAVSSHLVAGGDHGLRIAGKDGAATSAAALEGVCAALQRFLREAAAAKQQQQQPCTSTGGKEQAPAAAARRAPKRQQPALAQGGRQAAQRSGSKRARK